MTYSDRIKSIRQFLLEHKAVPINKFERPGDFVQENWLIRGVEIIIRLNQDGSWNAFIPCSTSGESADQIHSLHRFLDGKRHGQVLIQEMGHLAQTFLDKIQELPGCSSRDCQQQACLEKMALKDSIELFITRLSPGEASKKEEHAKH